MVSHNVAPYFTSYLLNSLFTIKFCPNQLKNWFNSVLRTLNFELRTLQLPQPRNLLFQRVYLTLCIGHFLSFVFDYLGRGIADKAFVAEFFGS